MRTIQLSEVFARSGGGSEAFRRFPLHVERTRLERNVLPHFHEFFEIDAVIKGGGVNRLDKTKAEFGAGDLLLGNMVEEHEIRQKDCEIISLKFGALATGSSAEEQAALLEPFLSGDEGFRSRWTPEPKVAAALLPTLEWMHAEPASPVTRHYFRALLLHIRSAWERRPEAAREKTSAPPPLPLRVMAWIDEHFADDVRIDRLARDFEMSPSRLNAVFRQAMGQSVKSYLGARRIAFARVCLGQGAGVSETAALSGFHDPSAFYRAFTKATGVSPKDYRGRVVE